MEYLEDGSDKEVAELDGMMKAMGVSNETLKRAKRDLSKEGKVKTWSVGYGSEKKFFCHLTKEALIPSESLNQ